MPQPFVQSRNIRPRDDCQQDKRNPIEQPCMTPCEQHDRRKDGQRGNRRNHHAPEVFRMRRTAHPSRGHHRANQQDGSHDAPIGKENADPKNERRQGAFARRILRFCHQARASSRFESLSFLLNQERIDSPICWLTPSPILP